MRNVQVKAEDFCKELRFVILWSMDIFATYLSKLIPVKK